MQFLTPSSVPVITVSHNRSSEIHLGSQMYGCVGDHIVKYHYITEQPLSSSQASPTYSRNLLALLESANLERDRFVSHLYQSRKDF